MRNFIALLLMLMLVGCGVDNPPVQGPDKQFSGAIGGALSGAGAGAITGFQVAAGTGPGAAVGAGIGAVAGSLQGIASDQSEENLLRLSAEAREARTKGWAAEVLTEQMRRRKELHPGRELYPADLFFDGDEVRLRPGAAGIIAEIAGLNKNRVPWSRLAVAAYVKAADKKSTFARHLATRRSRNIVDELIRNGLEPRRLVARAVVVSAPLLVDPHDRPDRYSQAIELIPIDR